MIGIIIFVELSTSKFYTSRDYNRVRFSVLIINQNRNSSPTIVYNNIASIFSLYRKPCYLEYSGLVYVSNDSNHIFYLHISIKIIDKIAKYCKKCSLLSIKQYKFPNIHSWGKILTQATFLLDLKKSDAEN